MSNYQNRCPICASPANIPSPGGGTFDVDCVRCGCFKITDVAEKILRGRGIPSERVANISGFIRENTGFLIAIPQIEFLLTLPTPPLFEKVVRLFQSIAKEFPRPGENFSINIWGVDNVLKKLSDGNVKSFDEPFLKSCQEILPWLARGWIEDGTEMYYIVQTVLKEGKGFLATGLVNSHFCISPAGWSFLLSQRQNSAQGNVAFVAMWFNPIMDDVWTKALYPGIEDAGYRPLRIDEHQHNNRIDDEIIVKIKECKFLVADFTSRRGGVYFEAGFALGLGKPVIWTIRERELKRVHFDTRQYCFVPWDFGDLSKFRRDLQFRIEATIGKGPSQPRSQ